MRRLALSGSLALLLGTLAALAPDVVAATSKSPTTAEIVAAASSDEWRELRVDDTLYIELPTGRVVIELAPALAPLHARNIKTLVRAGYFDGLAILRAQDNFVVQWGDPDDTRVMGTAKTELASEYVAPLSAGNTFTRLPDRDGYAPEVGFIDSMAAARDNKAREQWLTHCYGAVGVARGNDPLSGNGSSLYAVIGQAPRQLDRNIAVVGHVWAGMELLSTRPRGAGAMGFYEKPEQRLSILKARLAADVPLAERSRLQVLKSASKSFAQLLDVRRNRQDEWMRRPAGFVDICNVPVPVRPVP
jgi:peptidylprolyl isomerase